MRKRAAIACGAAGALAMSGCFWSVRLMPYGEIARTNDAAALQSEYARAARISTWGWLLEVHSRGSQAQYLDALWARLAAVERAQSERGAPRAGASPR